MHGFLPADRYYYYQFLHGQEAPLIDGIPYGGAGGGMVELGRKPNSDEETLRAPSPRARGKKEDEELGS